MGNLYPGAGAAVIGNVIQEGQYRIRYNDELICDLPVAAITTEVLAERHASNKVIDRKLDNIPTGIDFKETSLAILQHLNGAQKKYIYRHYDQFVKNNSVVIPGEADACVLAPIKDCDKPP